MTFDSEFNLSALDGSNGFIINGVSTLDLTGTAVSTARDVNGDSITDLIIGAPGVEEGAGVGASYVVFGSSAGFSSRLNLSSLSGTSGFIINGITAADASGISVSDAGDVNNDGIVDLLIGATGVNSGAGASYVVFGATSLSANLDLDNLNGTNGFVINGIDSSDLAGTSVSSTGDINNDGINDVIIGAPGANSATGESYVVFGSSSSFSDSLDLSTLDGDDGFMINGVNTADGSGISVSEVGDINGDGIDDLVIGASAANSAAGATYVLFGSDSDFNSSVNLSALDGNNGFIINGIDSSDLSGASVSNAGDVNDDGFNDIIIGAPDANNSAGESYVIFGSSADFSASLNLSDLDGSNGFLISGIDSGDRSGGMVSNAGDINGDGADDLIIGAVGGNNGIGEAYVVFGNRNDFEATVALSDLDGDNGFLINGIDAGDLVGTSVSTAGDINGDGVDDVIIGAAGAETSTGESYVIFGMADTLGTAFTIDFNSGTTGDRISGSVSSERIRGTGNNDQLFGQGGKDTLLGRNGNDRLNGGGGDDTLRGGRNQDELKGRRGDDRLLGQGGNDILIGGRGDDILIGGGGNDLFTYTSLRDGTDTIQRFNVNQDVIDLRDIFGRNAYAGDSDSARFARFVNLVVTNGSTEVRIDADGNGSSTATVTLAIVQNRTNLSSTNFVLS